MFSWVCMIALWLGCSGDDGDPGPGTGTQTNPDDQDGDGSPAAVDCDDGDAAVHEGADEACNGIDDDCDGDTDEDPVDGLYFYSDFDDDGYGNGEVGPVCEGGPGMVEVAGDCDETDPAINPGVSERCNQIDDDCDGFADDLDDDVLDQDAWYADADGDGFGAGAAIEACEQPGGRILNGSDCDDTDDSVHPGAIERCNGNDDDCDGSSADIDAVSIGNEGYSSIQDAVDDAASGATVTICEGDFDESIAVDKDIVLEGAGAGLSVIQGTGFDGVVHVDQEGIELTIRGLELSYGSGSYVSDLETYAGGGVEAWLASSLVIEDSTIERNEADMAGGILGPMEGDLVLTRTVVSFNDALDGSGGGAIVNHGTNRTVDIEDCEFTDNTSTYLGGGLAILQSDDGTVGSAAVSRTILDGNVALYGGGLVSTGLLALDDVAITNNEAGDVGGAWIRGDTTAGIDTVVSGNVASGVDGTAGGLWVDGCRWDDGVVEGNDADYIGGVMVTDGDLRRTVIRDNHANSAGGGLGSEDWSTLVDVQIVDNESDSTGGGILQYDGVLEVIGCAITGNLTVYGGGGAQIQSDLESVGSDWGTDKTDNDPDDILFFYSEEYIIYSDFGADADFICEPDVQTCE